MDGKEASLATTTEGERYKKLCAFLEESFSTTELERFLVFHDYGAVATAANPLAGATDYSYEVVRKLERRGLIDERFFGGLSQVLPAKQPEIQSLARLWLDDREEFVNSIGMRLKLIPAGEFEMGSPENDPNARNDEKPQHRVWITRPFYLGIHPVTRGQFRRFVEATRHQTEAEQDGKGGWVWDAAADKWVQDPKLTWRTPGFEQTNDHPVVIVSWNDALAFSDWLTRQEGQEYRLPTEAEWEYACRAGTATRFSFKGDKLALGRYAWYKDNSNNQTHPVGQKEPNGFGLYDMHGNVWEWCWDWYEAEYYRQMPADDASPDPRGPGRAAYRVIRGESWASRAEDARSARRGGSPPVTGDQHKGFRLARAPSGR
jgi:formylglycine-generating enzyme required for sulfatase activity